MFIQSNRRRCSPVVLALLAASLAIAPVAGAADPDWPGETDEGWRKVLSYGRCAFEVFSAVTPAQWAGALLDCGKLFIDEPPIGVGGL